MLEIFLIVKVLLGPLLFRGDWHFPLSSEDKPLCVCFRYMSFDRCPPTPMCIMYAHSDQTIRLLYTHRRVEGWSWDTATVNISLKLHMFWTSHSVGTRLTFLPFNTYKSLPHIRNWNKQRTSGYVKPDVQVYITKNLKIRIWLSLFTSSWNKNEPAALLDYENSWSSLSNLDKHNVCGIHLVYRRPSFYG